MTLYFWYTLRIVRKFKPATARKSLVVIFSTQQYQ